MTIRNSIIMGADDYETSPPCGLPPMGIGDGSIIESAILDKNCRVGRNVRVENRANVEEADGPACAIRGRIPIVIKSASLPDGWSLD